MYFQSAVKKLVSDDCTFPNVTVELVVLLSRAFFLGNSLDSSKLRLRIFQDPGPWLPTVFFFQTFSKFSVSTNTFFLFSPPVREKSYLFFRGPDKLGRRPLDDCRRGSLAPTQLIVNATALVLWSAKSVSGQVEEEVPKILVSVEPFSRNRRYRLCKRSADSFFLGASTNKSARRSLSQHICALTLEKVKEPLQR